MAAGERGQGIAPDWRGSLNALVLLMGWASGLQENRFVGSHLERQMQQ